MSQATHDDKQNIWNATVELCRYRCDPPALAQEVKKAYYELFGLTDEAPAEPPTAPAPDETEPS